MAKHTKITIQTDSLIILSGTKPLQVICPECGVKTEMIPISEIGVVSNLPLSEVKAWMQAEDLHRLRAADGTLLLCLRSMLKLVRGTT